MRILEELVELKVKRYASVHGSLLESFAASLSIQDTGGRPNGLIQSTDGEEVTICLAFVLSHAQIRLGTVRRLFP